jgi:hypothetical protein
MSLYGRPAAWILLALGLSSAPAAAVAAPSPKAQLASVLAAGRAERSVHYVAEPLAGHLGVSLVADVGRTRGIQRITYRARSGSGHVVAEVVGHVAYLRGDAFTLVHYLGFKATPAKTYAGSWIIVPPTNSAYATFAADVTLASAIGDLRLAAPLARLAPTQISGRRVACIRGKLPGSHGRTAALYARAAGTPLPVRESSSVGTLTLSRWNERVHVVAPHGATPISTTGLQ